VTDVTLDTFCETDYSATYLVGHRRRACVTGGGAGFRAVALASKGAGGSPCKLDEAQVAALGLGFAVTPTARSLLCGRYVVYRAVLFAVLAAPDVVWQALHGWPNYFVLGGKGYYPGGVYTSCFAHDALPASERAVAAIVACNYGEAYAVDRYGAALGCLRSTGHGLALLPRLLLGRRRPRVT
jgi:hypothetical protein